MYFSLSVYQYLSICHSVYTCISVSAVFLFIYCHCVLPTWRINFIKIRIAYYTRKCQRVEHVRETTLSGHLLHCLDRHGIYLRNRRWGGSVYVLQMFCLFVFCFFRPPKLWDNRSRERLNGFSWNFYQTIPGNMDFETSCRRLANGECWFA